MQSRRVIIVAGALCDDSQQRDSRRGRIVDILIENSPENFQKVIDDLMNLARRGGARS